MIIGLPPPIHRISDQNQSHTFQDKSQCSTLAVQLQTDNTIKQGSHAKMVSKNLFDYATSELSQDAFLCWLSANADSTDTVVHDAAQRLLFHCVQAPSDNGIAWHDDTHEDIQVLDVQHQTNHMDVFLQLKYEGKKYIVIIEDKTRSTVHDDQLNRYYDELSIDRSDTTIVGLYFKSDFVPERGQINQDAPKYVVMDYRDILACFGGKSKATNVIFESYRDHLQQRADKAAEYKRLPVNKWDDDQFRAFFDATLCELWKGNQDFKGSYGRNDNRNGGRFSMWFGNRKELGTGRDAFHLNLEAPSKKASTPWACRMIVRWNGNDAQEKRSKGDFDLPQIGESCGSRKGRFTIMGQLFSIDRKASDHAGDLTYKILKATEIYQQWCDANASE
jgi:hypothetical protein